MFVRIYTFINATERISCFAHEIIFPFLCISCILSRVFHFLIFYKLKSQKFATNEVSNVLLNRSFLEERALIVLPEK